MATFGQLTTRVVNKYKGSSGASFTTQAQAAINDAIEFYQVHHFWFSEGTASITLTASNPEVTTATGFPADFWYLHPDGGMAIVQSQSRYGVEKISVAEYDAMNSQGTGKPRYYREIAGLIQLYPYPNEAYTLEFRYIKKFTALSADSDTNAWTINAPQLIEARALSMLFLGEGHDGETMHNFWNNQENTQFNALRLVNNQRLATGNLQIN